MTNLIDRYDAQMHTLRTAYTAVQENALIALGWTVIARSMTTSEMRSPTAHWQTTAATVNQLINYLACDPPGVDLVRHSDGTLAQPVELWLPAAHCWINGDGGAINYGWKCKPHYYRPPWFTRWRLRRACRRWIALHYEGLT